MPILGRIGQRFSIILRKFQTRGSRKLRWFFILHMSAMKKIKDVLILVEVQTLRSMGKLNSHKEVKKAKILKRKFSL